MIDMVIDSTIFDSLLAQAGESSRLRMNRDLRNSAEDGSQRMLNAILPGSHLPVHRHRASSETVVCLKGRLDEVFYEVVEECEAVETSRCVDYARKRVVREVDRVHLEADGDVRMVVIPKGAWHTVEVLEPCVIFESKDGRYEPLGEEDMISL